VAKAAVVNLSESLAQEFGSKGIRVNCISPGQVGTDLWLGEQGVAKTLAKATGVDADTVRKTAASAIATGRFSTPQEVATLVTILASDRSANVTGVNYVIDGGLTKTT
jgi:NAD(P)-dependent dehydrogenase (short-subunit alcohol dehydrogenase family)